MEHSSEIVKKALKNVGMTQCELAEKIGKDQTLISRYLSGDIEVAAHTAVAIAGILDIDFVQLYHQLRWDKYHRKLSKLQTEFKDLFDSTTRGTEK